MDALAPVRLAGTNVREGVIVDHDGKPMNGTRPKTWCKRPGGRARRGAAGVRPDGTIDINAAMRSILEELLNAVMDEQASELSVLRNGYRERGLDTHVGAVTLKIPKLREGSYFPDDVVRRWSCTDAALASAIRDMLLSVSSAREVEATESRDNAGPSALAYLDFPREHATRARTNDVQERMRCEIKRRTRVAQVFPSLDSLVRLVGAVCCDQNDTRLASRNLSTPGRSSPGTSASPCPRSRTGSAGYRGSSARRSTGRGGWRSIGGGSRPSPGGALHHFS